MGLILKVITAYLVLMSAFIAYRYLEAPEDISHISKLPYQLSGNKNSTTMIVLIHGWPNTHTLWNEVIEKIQDKYLCLSLSFPNFSEEVKLRWGLDFDQVVQLAKQTIDFVEKDLNKNYEKALLTHDWGSIIGYLVDSKYPKLFKSFISLDVLYQSDSGFKSTILSISYQTYLASAFFIGGPVGDFMVNIIYNVVFKQYISGISEEEIKRIDSSWGYYYYYFWTNIPKFMKDLKYYYPSCEFTFIYGNTKGIKFHNEAALDKINKDPKGEVIAVQNGHWFIHDNLDLIVNLILAKF